MKLNRALTNRVVVRWMGLEKKIPVHFPLDNQPNSFYQKEILKRFDRAITTDYDVIVTGGGIAGLSCAYELSQMKGIKTALLDRNFHLGGAKWFGSQFYGPVIIRKPIHDFLKELQIPYQDIENVVIINHIATLLTTLMSKILLSNNVELLNGFNVIEYIVRNGKYQGVATNFSTMDPMMSPFIINSTAVVSSCGYWQSKGESLVFPFDYGLTNYEWDMNETDDALIYFTDEVKPSLVLSGGEVLSFGSFGKAKPSVGALIQSGRKAATLALKILEREKESDKARPVAYSTAGHFIEDQ